MILKGPRWEAWPNLWRKPTMQTADANAKHHRCDPTVLVVGFNMISVRHIHLLGDTSPSFEFESSTPAGDALGANREREAGRELRKIKHKSLIKTTPAAYNPLGTQVFPLNIIN